MGYTVTAADGSSEEFDSVVGYIQRDSAGVITAQRPLTSLEALTVARFDSGPPDPRREIIERIRQAYSRNAAFLALPDPAYPLGVAAQQALVDQVTALTRQVNGLIRINADLFEEGEPG